MQQVLALVDRAVAPVISRLESMELKIDRAIEAANRVASVEEAHNDTKDRVHTLEQAQTDQARQLSEAKGRNDIIMWLLGVIGGPTVVGLILAGLAKIMGVGP